MKSAHMIYYFLRPSFSTKSAHLAYVIDRRHFKEIGPSDLLRFSSHSGRWRILGGDLGRGGIAIAGASKDGGRF